VNCHAVGAEDGAGEVSSNNVRDPLRTNNPGRFIQRNAPAIFGIGGVQMLAETFNNALLADVAQAQADARAQGRNVTRALETQGVNFGSVTATAAGQVTINAQGVDRDLIVKPFDWSGVLPTVRSFIRDAFHQELGMNPVETAGDDVDGDFDGVANEILIEDVTAMTIYQAAQPRPVTNLELNQLRQNLNGRGAAGRQLAIDLGLPTLAIGDIIAINAGSQLFNQIGCNGCHIPALQTAGVMFSEPSQNPRYREAVFPAGQNAVARGVDPADPVTYDATADQPDNVIMLGNVVVARLGVFQRNGNSAVVRLFGDLKRHDMGPGLAENIDAGGNGPAVFVTENLWGVGSTPQYLHDGRATTIREAIREHGGEAQASRNAYFNLNANNQRNVIRFLKNQVLFKVVEEEEGSSDTDAAAAE
jgi:cytochrome c551/c552